MSDQTATLNLLLKTQSDLSGIKAAVSSFDGFVNKLKSGFQLNLGANLASAIAAIPREIQKFGAAALDMAGDLKDATDQYNASAEALQVLGIAATDGGADVEILRASITKFSKALADARDGSSASAQAFRRLGLDAATLEQIPLERRFEALARAQVNSADQTIALRAVMEILGSKNAPKLQGALQDLAAQGYDALATAAKAAGRVMEDETIARLDRAEKSIERLKNKTVILAGEMIAAFDAIGESAKKSPFQTFLASMSAGFSGVAGYGALAGTVAGNITPTAERKTAGVPSSTTDFASVQRLITLENELGAIRSGREATERQLKDTESVIASIEGNELLTRTEKEARLNKYLEQQQDLLDRRFSGLENERKQLLAINALRDAGFVTKGDNSPDLVAARAVSSFDQSRLTPEQLQSMAEKRKRDASVSATADLQGETLAASGSASQAASLNSFSGELRANIVEMQNAFVTVAQAVTSVMGTAITSVSAGITGLINGTMEWRDAFASVGLALEQSVIKAFSDMAAQWVVQHAVMAAVGDTFRAGEVAGHVVMEEVKTGATATGEGARTGSTLFGSLARKGIQIAETIFHGAHVAIRTAAHVAGEILKTGVTVVQAGIRIASIIAESIASVIQGAVQAFSALSSIPYVGPFLGAAAMAAALVGGFALVRGISKGFESGGYTGDGPSSQVAGVVHAGEWVVPASRTREIGIARLSAMTYGNKLPGYASGGLVAPVPAGGEGANGRGGPTGPNVTLTPRFIVVDSDREASRIADTEENEAYFLRLSRKHGMI